MLDNLVNWHQKSSGLASLATKYMDTLEEYKMMFVAMKQLLKEKDCIVRKTKSQLMAQQEVTRAHLEQVKRELQASSQF